jgi:hypothetical protein
VLKRAKVLHNEELAEQIKLEKARSAHEETLANLEQLEVLYCTWKSCRCDCGCTAALHSTVLLSL